MLTGTTDADLITVTYDPQYGYPDDVAIDYLLSYVNDEQYYWVESFTPSE